MLSEEIVKSLMQNTSQRHTILYFLLSSMYALRIEEILKLKIEDRNLIIF